MILAFFSYFWLFWDFSLAVGMFNFVARYWYTGCVIYALDRIRWDDGRRWRDGKAVKEHEMGILARSTLAHVGTGVKRACGG